MLSAAELAGFSTALDAITHAPAAPSLANVNSLIGSLGTTFGSLASGIQQFHDLVLSGVSTLGYIDAPAGAVSAQAFAMQDVSGTGGADRLQVGTVGNFHLMGLDGNDTLIGGRTGSHSLEGGKGDDSYTIYQTSDQVIEKAGEGNDTVLSYVNYTLGANIESLRAMAAGLTLHGNALDNSIVGANGGCSLYGEAGNDVLNGGNGSDVLNGGTGNDRLYGLDGNDTMEGGQGNDTLSGGNGNDVLYGCAGDDNIEGGAGADVLSGGAGADGFNYRPGDFGPDLHASMDTIIDFKAAEGDRINLTMIDANTATAANDHFQFIAGQDFHGVAGELRYAADGNGITVYGDTNGDGHADLAIHLSGLTTITSSAFYL